MGTFTISASGFAALPATPPAGWPSNLVWPGGALPNGSKSWTVSDADWVDVVNWSANRNNAALFANATPQGSPTVGQILIDFAQIFVDGIKQAVVQFLTAAPSAPPPPTFT